MLVSCSIYIPFIPNLLFTQRLQAENAELAQRILALEKVREEHLHACRIKLLKHTAMSVYILKLLWWTSKSLTVFF